MIQYQLVTIFNIVERHYNYVLKSRSDARLADSSRSWVDAQSLVDGLLVGFGAGGFTHVQGRAVGAFAGLVAGAPTISLACGAP